MLERYPLGNSCCENGLTALPGIRHSKMHTRSKGAVFVPDSDDEVWALCFNYEEIISLCRALPNHTLNRLGMVRVLWCVIMLIL